MATTVVEQLADFTADADFSRLPSEVVEECKRLLLDSVGCALAAVEHDKGRIGIEYGRMTGGSNGYATIIGTADVRRSSGQPSPNGELINASDFDVVLPPGPCVAKFRVNATGVFPETQIDSVVDAMLNLDGSRTSALSCASWDCRRPPSHRLCKCRGSTQPPCRSGRWRAVHRASGLREAG